VTVLLVPAALLALVAILWLATSLETRRVQVLVRLTVRSKDTSPELAEALVAAELAPVLQRNGFTRTA
jgi:hypothetical protein